MQYLLAFFFISSTSYAIPQPYRGLNPTEVEFVKSPNSIKQIYKGFIPEKLAISQDGSLMVAKVYADDPANPHLFLLNEDGSFVKEVDKPYGFAENPYLHFDKEKKELYLYAYLEPAKKGMKKGIYRKDLKNKTPWTPWNLNTGYVDYFTFSPDFKFILMRKTSPMPGSKEEIFVQEISRSLPTGSPYRVASNIQFGVDSATFSKSTKNIFFTKREGYLDTIPTGKVHVTENKAGSLSQEFAQTKDKQMISLNGKGIIVKKEKDLVKFSLINAKGNEGKLLFDCPLRMKCKLLNFSPDGTKAFVSARFTGPEKFFTLASGLLEITL